MARRGGFRTVGVGVTFRLVEALRPVTGTDETRPTILTIPTAEVLL